MDKFVIYGGNKLYGEVRVSGAKNAALAILPATILCRDVCLIENIPSISDVSIILQMLRSVGAEIRIINKSTVEIDTKNVNTSSVPSDLARHLRASYYFLGALLGCLGEARSPLPGGCDFGDRPIDQHLKGFRALGAHDSLEHGVISITSSGLEGASIYFDVVSVGATMNVMLASVMAKGTTVLENCAKEPHIVDLANFLNSMGADIRGAGTDVIKVHGVTSLHGVEYSIIPDQIEAGTFLAATALCGGEVTVTGVTPKHLESIVTKLVAVGCEVTEYDEAVKIKREGPLNKVNVKTMPHPGFPTDMQPQMTAVLSVCEGTSIVTESVWDHRFKYVDELRRLGASLQVDGKVAIVEGVEYLSGAPVKATDLRAGAALIIAGLGAKGVTEIEDIYHVERGYSDILEKIQGIGGDIKKVTIPGTAMSKAL